MPNTIKRPPSVQPVVAGQPERHDLNFKDVKGIADRIARGDLGAAADLGRLIGESLASRSERQRRALLHE